MGIAAGLPEGGQRLIVDFRLPIADSTDAANQSAIRNSQSAISGYDVLIARDSWPRPAIASRTRASSRAVAR